MICPRCKEDKDSSGFAKNKAHPSGYNYYCRPCNSAKRLERLGRGLMRRGRKDKDWDAPIRTCNRCKTPKPKDDFFKKVSQCKVCVDAVRKIRQEKRRAQRRAQRSWRIDLMDISHSEKVVIAITRGAKSQHLIGQMTRLSDDYVCDALADLYDQGKLDRAAIRQRVYRMAA